MSSKMGNPPEISKPLTRSHPERLVIPLNHLGLKKMVKTKTLRTFMECSKNCKQYPLMKPRYDMIPANSPHFHVNSIAAYTIRNHHGIMEPAMDRSPAGCFAYLFWMGTVLIPTISWRCIQWITGQTSPMCDNSVWNPTGSWLQGTIGDPSYKDPGLAWTHAHGTTSITEGKSR